MPKQQHHVTEEVLHVPTNVKTDSHAQEVTDEEKRIRRETSERLFRQRFLSDDRSLYGAWVVSVIGQGFTQPTGHMPNADRNRETVVNTARWRPRFSRRSRSSTSSPKRSHFACTARLRARFAWGLFESRME